MELAKYIADKLGVKLQIEAMAFDACMAAIGQGRVDLTICGMVPKEERKTTMDFSDVYYNDGDQVIVIMKDISTNHLPILQDRALPPRTELFSMILLQHRFRMPNVKWSAP